MLSLVCIWTMWDLNKGRYAVLEYAFFVLKSVMLTSRVDPRPYVLTGSVLPRVWLFGTREAAVALDAKFVALGF